MLVEAEIARQGGGEAKIYDDVLARTWSAELHELGLIAHERGVIGKKLAKCNKTQRR